MCGIAGVVNLDNSPVECETIRRMVGALKHRGPDSQTEYLDGPVGFGHARLSIIDLEGGHQPLFNEDRTVSVICNGEIYNFRELRKRLTKSGHQFRTGSDCEVLTHLWEESGPQMVDELRGMFAFVLYDNRRGIVFGARDRFGQKPLYYHYDTNGFSFASEIKGLLVRREISRDLDTLALDQFLFHQFIPQPRTLFDSIKKLAAGCCFELHLPPRSEGFAATEQSGSASEVSRASTTPESVEHFALKVHPASQRSPRGSSLKIRRYWQPTFAPDDSLSTANHLARVEEGLINAVQSHMVADVPIGVFLSGGIDSSLITALAGRFNPEPLETFSISFPGSEKDEAPFARAVSRSLGTNHHEFPFDSGDMRQLLTRAAVLFDQPLADAAVLPLMVLSGAAAEYVKVVLTGDGGDELFAGYRKYQRMVAIPGRYRWLSNVCSRLFPMHELSACRPDSTGSRRLRTRLAMLISPLCRSEYHRQGWEGWERFALYRPETSQQIVGSWDSLRDPCESCLGANLDPLNAALNLDQGTVLADRLLLKADYAAMAYGLEARAPLLDHELAAIAGQLPLHLKSTSSRTKVALRDIATRYLPADIINRRKKGFSLPLDRWFRNELLDWVKVCLIDESVALSRYFQRSVVEHLLQEHVAGKDHSGRILTLLVFELWCREYAR